MRTLHGLGALACLLVVAAVAAPPESVKVTVRIAGAHDEECVAVLRDAVAKTPGFKLPVAEIKAGEPPRCFSPLLPLEISDPAKANLGKLAQAVAAAKTPHRQEFPPRLLLVLFGEVDETAVNGLRAALHNVPGIEPDAGGSIGGFPNEGTFWVRLEGDGQATLTDIRRALKEGMVRATLAKQ